MRGLKLANSAPDESAVADLRRKWSTTISKAAGLLCLVQLNRNKSLSKASVIAAIVLVVFALDTVLTPTVAASSPAPTEPTSPSPAPAAAVSEAKPTPKDTAADNSTLYSLLKQEGFGVVKLRQENLDNQKAHNNDPKHLVVDVQVNRVSASLMVDTGTPTTNIRSEERRVGKECRGRRTTKH